MSYNASQVIAEALAKRQERREARAANALEKRLGKERRIAAAEQYYLQLKKEKQEREQKIDLSKVRREDAIAAGIEYYSRLKQQKAREY